MAAGEIGSSPGDTGKDRIEKESSFIFGFKNKLLIEEGLAQNTVDSYLQDINDFLEFCGWKEIDKFSEVDIFLLTDYLEECQKREYSSETISRRLSTLNRFFSYLKNENFIDSNPVEKVDSPRGRNKYPDYLSESEVEQLLAAPDTEKPGGLLERALLEILYGCGLRASEVAKLKGENIDWERKEILIEGKGSKQRIVPLGREALKWLKKYTLEIKTGGSRENEFFVGLNGKPITRQKVWKVVKKNAGRADLNDVSPHTLRHSFATHMLSAGADLRSLQEMLGHSDVGTTANIYVHLRDEVSSAHGDFHPRGK